MSKSQKITPFLWFDSQAEEAATFYVSLFADSHISNVARYGNEGQEVTGQQPGTVMTVNFQLAGCNFIALNGGPHFTLNPSISFYVTCETEAEIDALWAGLGQGGGVLMPLDKYEWSAKFGWLQDKYGVNWQLTLGPVQEIGQKIIPALLFVGAQNGRAEEAIRLYTETFPESKIDLMARYEAGEGGDEGTVKHAQFWLNGEKFIAMDSSFDHAFAFNEAISLQIACETQAEVDHFWSRFTANGGEESQCGWLKDPFGATFKIVQPPQG